MECAHTSQRPAGGKKFLLFVRPSGTVVGAANVIDLGLTLTSRSRVEFHGSGLRKMSNFEFCSFSPRICANKVALMMISFAHDGRQQLSIWS
jgi:hypothetical protein